MSYGMMMKLSSLGLVIGIATIAACDPNEDASVHLVYEQVADFGSYTIGSGPTAASPDGLYVMYRINQIANTGAQAKPFVFSPHDLVLATSSKITNEEPGADNILLGSQFASSVMVAAGQVLQKPKGIGCVIKIARATDPQTLIGQMIDPVATFDEDQPLNLDREAGNTSEATVIGDASPTTLQNLCNTL